MKPGGGSAQVGVAAALAAFVFWGLAPIYFKLLLAVAPLEIIAHRILWSVPMLAGFLWLRDRAGFRSKLRLPPRTVLVLFVSGCLVAINWLIFVWAVVNGQVLSTSLGYFIGPLVNFLLGFVFLKERLTRIQAIAVAIAASGTVYLGWFLGTPPWISLGLAFSFGLYGLVRKVLAVGPMVGLLWETTLLAVPAGLLLAWLAGRGELSFAGGDPVMDGLLVLAGLVTILPLIWFNVAARTLTLTTLGFFQYIAPSLTFMLSVFVYGEAFTQGHAVAFSCIWLALVMVSTESVLRSRRSVQAARAGRPLVVLVHGLWFGAWSMAVLARRLRRAGFEVRRFNYRSTRGDLDAHARALEAFAGSLPPAPELHFVGHSLGGLVVLRMLAANDDELPAGRVVLLGSPLGGSEAARRAGRLPASHLLFGAVRPDLENGYRQLPGGRPVGMIAGSRAVGLGWLVGGPGGPGDGTVGREETRAPGLAGHYDLPVSHTGLLFGSQVARQTIGFLRRGRFDDAVAGALTNDDAVSGPCRGGRGTGRS